MNILAIETSCDETSVAIITVDESSARPVCHVRAHVTASQASLHSVYGGVFPMLAKREHEKAIIPLITQALHDARMLADGTTSHTEATLQYLDKHDAVLATDFAKFFDTHATPEINAIVVTSGPGLEPALWVGINSAQTLGLAWNIPVMSANHMEGHILSILVPHDSNEFPIQIDGTNYPILALLISGGHTELVLVNQNHTYIKIGETRDDAVGEAFDKVARMMDLPYPGGPEISKLGAVGRKENKILTTPLPRPMLHSQDFDFSFSGIKTAVLYLLRDYPDTDKHALAREFEDAVIEVLLKKTNHAIAVHGVQSLIVAGGVSANKQLREVFAEHIDIPIHFPDHSVTGDNALMIALAGYMNIRAHKEIPEHIIASGNLEL